MNLRAIQQSAGYLSDNGTAADVKAVANLVMQLAKSTDQLGQLIHDHVCISDPALGVKLSDFLEHESPAPREMQCEACADLFTGNGQICPDCVEHARRGLISEA